MQINIDEYKKRGSIEERAAKRAYVTGEGARIDMERSISREAVRTYFRRMSGRAGLSSPESRVYTHMYNVCQSFSPALSFFHVFLAAREGNKPKEREKATARMAFPCPSNFSDKNRPFARLIYPTELLQEFLMKNPETRKLSSVFQTLRNVKLK